MNQLNDGGPAATEPPVPGAIRTEKSALKNNIKPSTKGRCEYTDSCLKFARYWVQRGPINRMACTAHLHRTITEFWEIEPGRYGVSEHYEGYWISSHHSVVVKMRVGDGWR